MTHYADPGNGQDATFWTRYHYVVGDPVTVQWALYYLRQAIQNGGIVYD
jgi:hypothetical protein